MSSFDPYSRVGLDLTHSSITGTLIRTTVQRPDGLRICSLAIAATHVYEDHALRNVPHQQ